MLLRDPAYLWALLGLLVPLAIHLLSRKAGKVIRVGSIRHLTETTTRKFSSIRFNEGLLFALRALLLLVFVSLLAGLSIRSKNERPRWLLLEPGIAINDTGLQRTIDSLLQAGFEWRHFSPGFPAVGETPADSSRPNYPFLLSELQAAGVEAVVLAGNRIQAFKGKQQALPPGTSWIQVPVEGRKSLLRATMLTNDSVRLLSAGSSADRMEFQHRLQRTAQALQEAGEGKVALTDAKTIAVLLLAPPEFAREATIVKSAIDAIAEVSRREIRLKEAPVLPDTSTPHDLLITFVPLSKAPPEAGKIIRFREQPGSKLLVQTGRHSWELTARLERELALEQELPLALAAILLDDPVLTQEIAAIDQRAIDEQVFFTGRESDQQLSGIQFSKVDKWLSILLLVIFVLERNIVFFRRT